MLSFHHGRKSVFKFKCRGRKLHLAFMSSKRENSLLAVHGNERAQRLEIGWWNESDLLLPFLRWPKCLECGIEGVLKIIIKKEEKNGGTRGFGKSRS
jgi:hypothetical protein